MRSRPVRAPILARYHRADRWTTSRPTPSRRRARSCPQVRGHAAPAGRRAAARGRRARRAAPTACATTATARRRSRRRLEAEAPPSCGAGSATCSTTSSRSASWCATSRRGWSTFPTVRDGEPAWLCWRLADPELGLLAHDARGLRLAASAVTAVHPVVVVIGDALLDVHGPPGMRRCARAATCPAAIASSPAARARTSPCGWRAAGVDGRPGLRASATIRRAALIARCARGRGRGALASWRSTRPASSSILLDARRRADDAQPARPVRGGARRPPLRATPTGSSCPATSCSSRCRTHLAARRSPVRRAACARRLRAADAIGRRLGARRRLAAAGPRRPQPRRGRALDRGTSDPRRSRWRAGDRRRLGVVVTDPDGAAARSDGRRVEVARRARPRGRHHRRRRCLRRRARRSSLERALAPPAPALDAALAAAASSPAAVARSRRRAGPRGRRARREPPR